MSAQKCQEIAIYDIEHFFFFFFFFEFHGLPMGDLPPDREPLDWNTRMKIAAGAAKGLEYLYNKANPPDLYRDFKSSIILMEEGFHLKLFDFGLAKLGPVLQLETSHMFL
ncbi:hypothetical protein EZV62_017316 [Acer yangbiense]|uniref:Protein kinase domain-containing protein n=1 Tax=Acer yangbiense TaxID=1000413 RepID=A0A5C7HFV1_9ROSI|nr:hypothetical protein EZV62_017316 [Acer yangbiense]